MGRLEPSDSVTEGEGGLAVSKLLDAGLLRRDGILVASELLDAALLEEAGAFVASELRDAMLDGGVGKALGSP